MLRREFLAQNLGAALALSQSFAAITQAADAKKPKVLLRSGWQTVNIGDIGHTPGALRLLYENIPGVEVRLWPSSIGDGAQELFLKRFPELKIVKSEGEIAAAFNECDFMLHGSGGAIVAHSHLARWHEETKKPFGVYGITFAGTGLELLNHARFVFFRDSVSLKVAQDKGCTCPVLEFGPDAAFAVDLRNDAAADKFLREHELADGKFLCCIPRLRYTPYWLVPQKNRPLDEKKDARNEEMKEHDHKPLRDAITAVVRETPMKILLCPEDVTQIKVGKEMVYDKLPDDVRAKVVWRDRYWLTDEAMSTYVHSAGLFGLEMHSPIMCIGNGVPALVGRFDEQTTKGLMWRDIGLGDWLFDFDNTSDLDRLTPTVLKLATDPQGAKAMTAKAKAFVEKRQRETMAIVKKNVLG